MLQWWDDWAKNNCYQNQIFIANNKLAGTGKLLFRFSWLPEINAYIQGGNPVFLIGVMPQITHIRRGQKLSEEEQLLQEVGAFFLTGGAIKVFRHYAPKMLPLAQSPDQPVVLCKKLIFSCLFSQFFLISSAKCHLSLHWFDAIIDSFILVPNIAAKISVCDVSYNGWWANNYLHEYQEEMVICHQTPLVVPVALKICTWEFFNVLNPIWNQIWFLTTSSL